MKKILAWVWILIVIACLYSGVSLLVNSGRGVTFLEGLAHTTVVGAIFIVVILSFIGIYALTLKCIDTLNRGL